jgi:ribonuclease P protein component
VPTRFGITVSRKVSKKAVERNRIRRQIQAALITLRPRLVTGGQVVIIVRQSGVACQYREFLRELEQTLSALEVINGHS